MSILEAENKPDRRADERLDQRISSAWRVVGRTGQATVAGAVVLCLVVTVMWVAESAAALATGVSLVVLVVAALVDVAEHRLPNALVALAGAPVLAAVALAGSAGHARGAALGAAVLGGPLLVTHLVRPAGMGFGDVKAGIVLGAAIGLIDPQIALLALVLALSGAAAWGLARHSRSVALGPGLVGGALAALLAANVLGLVETSASW